MHQRQWKATWTSPQGITHTYTFYAPDNRVIAGIDLRLKLMNQGRPLPEVFFLEEGRIIERPREKQEHPVPSPASFLVAPA